VEEKKFGGIGGRKSVSLGGGYVGLVGLMGLLGHGFLNEGGTSWGLKLRLSMEARGMGTGGDWGHEWVDYWLRMGGVGVMHNCCLREFEVECQNLGVAETVIRKSGIIRKKTKNGTAFMKGRGRKEGKRNSEKGGSQG